MELTNIIEEVYNRCAVVIGAATAFSFSLSDYDFNIRASEREYWVEYFGFKQWIDAPDYNREVKEVFRAVCYKYNMIFIDKTQASEIEE